LFRSANGWSVFNYDEQKWALRQVNFNLLKAATAKKSSNQNDFQIMSYAVEEGNTD
jgi:hypothetical protein